MRLCQLSPSHAKAGGRQDVPKETLSNASMNRGGG